MSHTLLHNVLIPFLKGAVTVVALGLAAGILTWIERRLLGRLQIRKGPNRVGPQGFFQWIADTVKLVFKEDIVPSRAEKALHLLGPLLLFVPAVVVLGLSMAGWNVLFSGGLALVALIGAVAPKRS